MALGICDTASFILMYEIFGVVVICVNGISGCGDGWILSERSQKCFYVINEMLSYRDAQAACEITPGQTLACVAYEEDVQALKQGTNLPYIDYWLDLYKETHNEINDIHERRASFRWSDGSPSTAWMGSFWAEQEPSFSERYGRLANNMSSFKGITDDALNGFICQKAAPQLETSTFSSTTVEIQSVRSGRAQQFTTAAVLEANTQVVPSKESTLEVTNEIGVGGGVGLVLIVVIIVAVVIVIRKRKYKRESNKAAHNTYVNTIGNSTSNQEATTKQVSENSEGGGNPNEKQKYEILDINDYERVDDLPHVLNRDIGCGNGWILSVRSHKCFHVSNEELDYWDAQSACENISGARLASVAYEEDIQALKQGTNLSVIEYWIDLYREYYFEFQDIGYRRAAFRWGDGSPNTAWMGSFWADAEPGLDEKYGRFADNMSSFKGHRGDILNGYICQKAAPETTTSSSTTVATQSIRSGRAQQFTTIAMSNVNTQEVSSNESTLEVTYRIDSMVYIAAGVGGGVVSVLIIVMIIMVLILIRKRKRKYQNDATKAAHHTYDNTIADTTLSQEETIRPVSVHADASENQNEEQQYEILDYECVDDVPQASMPNGDIGTINTIYTGINVQDLNPYHNEYDQLETTYKPVETDSIKDHRVDSNSINSDYELL